MNGTNNDSDAKAYADGWQDDDGNVPVLSPEPEAGKEFKGLQEKADAEFNDGWNSDLEPKASDSGVVASPVIGDRAVAVENLPAIEPAKPMSFKETFAAQRKAGATVFEWGGKKYTTDLKKSAPAKSAPASGTSTVKAVQSVMGNMPAVVTARVQTPAAAPSVRAPGDLPTKAAVYGSSSSGRNYAPTPQKAPLPSKASIYGSSGGRNYTPVKAL